MKAFANIKVAALLVLYLLLGWTPPVSAAGQDSCKLVFLFSYNPEFWAVMDEDQGLVQGLAESGLAEGQNAEVVRLYMDTKRKNKTEEQMRVAGEELAEEIRAIAPDVLFIMDDDALRHVGGKLFDNGPPIVFAGVNLPVTNPDYAWLPGGSRGPLADSLERPGHNITGVQETMNLAAGFKLLHEILPRGETALFLSDNSLAGTEFLRAAGGEGALDNPYFRIVGMEYTDSFETLKRLVLDHQDTVDCIVLFIPWTLEDENGQHVPQEEVVRWMVLNNRRPGVAYLDILAQEGYLCGVVVDMVQQGRHAALMGARILNGENPADMPVLDPVANRIIVNLARAQQLGVDVPFSVLKDADVVHKEMSAYPEFKFKE